MQYTYYFNQEKDEKKLYSLIDSNLFQQIVDFFIKHENQRVILRQLKKDIKTNENLELFLDKMIQFRLISRLDRHYSLTFPIYDLADYPLNFSKNLITLLDSIQQKEMDHVIGFVGELLWDICETEEDYFFCVKTNISTTSFYKKRIIGDSDLKMVAIQDDEESELTIPAYFELQSLNELPEHYGALEKLLGDVNPEYFFGQFKKLLKKAQKNRSTNTRRDIFEESLLMTTDLIINHGKLYLTRPIIDSETLWIEESNSKQIIKLLKELWQNYDTVNEQTLMKKMIYSKLMRYYFNEKKGLTYYLV